MNKYEPVIDRSHPLDPNGLQKVYRFSNGYGASVVRSRYSYGNKEGKYELAVIQFDNQKNDSWDLCYETHLTNDVLGWLTWDEVEKYLSEIEKL